MHVSFIDDNLGRLCGCLRSLCQRWGPDDGQRVARRLWELAHAPDFRAVRALPGRCRPDGEAPRWMIDVAQVGTIHFTVIDIPEARPPTETLRVTNISGCATQGEEANRVSINASEL